MAIYKNDVVDIDLETGTVSRSFANRMLGEGDINGNRFGFRCLRNKTPISLNGTSVVGHFTRADGNTIVINGGAVTGDTAVISLPQACYAVEGTFTLAIKLSGGGVTGTIRMVDGTVVKTTNGAMIDPGNVIPDLSDYLAVVEEAEAAAAIINGISIAAELISGENYNIIVTKS